MTPHDHGPRTTQLLERAIASHVGETITLEELLDSLGERAYGFLLLVLALPNFIPVPIGVGGVMGILVVLTGLQMLVGLEHPWLPKALRRKAFSRESLRRFTKKISPALGWLERVCRPRLEMLVDHPVHHVTGLLVVLTGIALALPIPFTNYPFGFLVIVFAVALIERDGALLLVAWIASLAVTITLLTLSQAVADAVRHLF